MSAFFPGSLQIYSKAQRPPTSRPAFCSPLLGTQKSWSFFVQLVAGEGQKRKGPKGRQGFLEHLSRQFLNKAELIQKLAAESSKQDCLRNNQTMELPIRLSVLASMKTTTKHLNWLISRETYF